MLSRKGQVDRAIHFRHPSRIPLWIPGGNPKNSDIFNFDLSLPDATEPQKSEWGFARIKDAAGFWAVPEEPTLPNWSAVDAYPQRTIDPMRRLSGIVKAAEVCQDRYRLASLGLSGFSIYRALRGNEHSAVDALIEPERFLELMELIFEFEGGLFDMIARKGFHGIEFRDDWLDRQTSRMTLSLWRKLLKHRYAGVIQRAKDSALDVWFSVSEHCGEFFGDLSEIGVDVIRIESPYRMEITSLGRLYRGKICFAVRLDEMIRDGGIAPEEIRPLFDCLASEAGGFIGMVPETFPVKITTKVVRALAKISKNP